MSKLQVGISSRSRSVVKNGQVVVDRRWVRLPWFSIQTKTPVSRQRSSSGRCDWMMDRQTRQVSDGPSISCWGIVATYKLKRIPGEWWRRIPEVVARTVTTTRNGKRGRGMKLHVLDVSFSWRLSARRMELLTVASVVNGMEGREERKKWQWEKKLGKEGSK